MPELLEIVRGHGRRLDAAERELGAMRERIARLEAGTAPAPRAERPAVAQPPTPAPAPSWAPPAPGQAPLAPAPGTPTPPPARAPKPRMDLEELLGGRVLGLLGALAVLLGVAFLVAMAVDRGWIDEPTRIAIGFGGCSALLLGAVLLYERRGRTQAALAAAGAAVAGLFATLTAGAQLYELFPVGVSLLIAGAIGAAATALALRWDARTFAGLGLLGALVSPWLVGADQSNLVVSFVLFVLTIALRIADLRRWAWLSLSAAGLGAIAIGDWLTTIPAGPLKTVVVLSYFGAVALAAAAGAERSRPGEQASPTAAVLVAGAALFLAPTGYFALENIGLEHGPKVWLFALAAVLAAAGVAGVAAPRISRDLAHLPIALGLGIADIAFALAVDGVELALGWAASAALLVALGRLRAADAVRLSLLAGAQLGLALTHAVTIDAEPADLAGPPHDVLAGVVSLGAVGLAALLAAQLLPRVGVTRAGGHAVAMLVLAYLSALVLEGPLLAAALAAEAVAILVLARRGAGGLDSVGAVGAVSLLACALLHGLVFEAAPRALVYGADDLVEAAVALTAIAAAAIAMALLYPGDHREERLGFAALGAAALVYLGSVAIVTAFQPDAGEFEHGLGLLDERQRGQLLLSAFWAVTGVGALILGLVRRSRAVRVGGFVLLGIATTKVFLFDLSALEAMYRVGSFVALGLLLLGAAFAWQRTIARNDEAEA